MENLKKYWKNAVCLQVLSVLYVLVYFMAPNFYEYSLGEYLESIFMFLLYMLFCWGVFYSVSRFHFVVAVIVYLLLYFLGASVVLSATICHLKAWYFYVGALLGLGIVPILLARKFFKYVVFFLVALIVVAASNYGHQSFQYSKMKQKYTDETSYLLRDRPNIYMIVLESYLGHEALKEILDYDNEPFLSFLRDNKFKVYDDFYSTTFLTKWTLNALFEMAPTSNEDKREIEDVLSLEMPTKVLKTLDRNGYDLHYKFADNYLIHRKVNFSLGSLRENMLVQNSFLKQYVVPPYALLSLSDFVDELEKDIESLEGSRPLFYMTKVGARYADKEDGLSHVWRPELWSNNTSEHTKVKALYVRELKKTNKLLEGLVETIVKKDPNAVVILFGDHGPMFSEVWDNEHKEKNVTQREICLDHFNVLMAVRWPDYLDYFREKNFHFIPELFGRIFTSLNPSLRIRALRVGKHCYFKGRKK